MRCLACIHETIEAQKLNVCVIGGGAAGFFGAIAAAELGHRVTILEANESVLAKVRVSGGGRCNVTHHCFDPRELVKAYPRGGKALRGPFSKFQPTNTVEWFAARGVETKTESDGRMFPITDDSATIVNCLEEAAADAGVTVQTKTRVVAVKTVGSQFSISLQSGDALVADRVLFATGGSRAGFDLAHELGHQIVSPVPSLFTFVVKDPRLHELQGVSVEHVECELLTPEKKFKQSGPLLVTHWGMSGPAVLKLSAWAARQLYDSKYNATLRVNWLPNVSIEKIRAGLASQRAINAKRSLASSCPWPLPKRLWKSLVEHVVGGEVRWAELPKKSLQTLAAELSAGEYQVAGKGQFKEEFVTCGGVRLDEVDFRSMQSRLCPGLFFAGEILDIDAVTGGFNFQNAWTTAWIAGNAM